MPTRLEGERPGPNRNSMVNHRQRCEAETKACVGALAESNVALLISRAGLKLVLARANFSTLF